MPYDGGLHRIEAPLLLSRRYRLVGAPPPDAAHVTVVAQDRFAGATCVVKLAAAGSAAAEELSREAGTLGELGHPRLLELTGVVDGMDAPSLGGRVAGFATRWVDGLPLTEALSGHERPDRLAAFAQLVDVTGYLHRRGLLHLDLKPSNAL